MDSVHDIFKEELWTLNRLLQYLHIIAEINNACLVGHSNEAPTTCKLETLPPEPTGSELR